MSSNIFQLLDYAAKGDLSGLRRLQQMGVDMNTEDYDQRRPLHLAAAEGRLDCVRFLLEECRVPHCPRDRWNNTPVSEAKRGGHEGVVRYITEYTAKEDDQTSGAHIYMMLNAAAKGHIDTLNSLFKEGRNMTKADYDSRTALHLAAAENHLNCVKFLIETCGVPVIPRDRWYNTPLDEAKRGGHSAVVSYLEQQQALHRKKTSGKDVYSLLSMAKLGDLPGINKLLQAGMDFNTDDYDNRTALHLAAAEGQLDCVKFLVERCDVTLNPKDRWGNTPLDEAKRFNKDAVVEYLVKKMRVSAKAK